MSDVILELVDTLAAISENSYRSVENIERTRGSGQRK